MATSPLFGWQEPDDTSLVKDGAAAIRTLGNAIDTSMGDLLGGTTGQVLAKASNTNMDFSWVAQDDSNAIQNAIVDAKGDLIAATANDTPARLAVGANDLLVTAASGEATGLKYTGGWISYTPTLTNITLGNGTLTGRYCQIGKTVTVYVGFKMGSTSAMGNFPAFSIPITAVTNNVNYQIMGELLDAGTADWTGSIILEPASGKAYVQVLAANVTYVYPTALGSTVPFTWTTNDGFQFIFSYEVA